MAARPAEVLARLRVCRDAGQPVSPDLRDEAITCLERIGCANELRARRDKLIRQAALLVPTATEYHQAKALAAEAKAMARTWHILRNRPPVEVFTSPRDYLHAARLVMALPKSQRQFYRVLKSFED